MKIVFLCGSLEPGRDGVGDYTRRIAIEMIKRGNEAAIVALNDTFVHQEFSGFQKNDGGGLPVLRVPSVWKASKRFLSVSNYINNFDPEWISLQFVPFAFNEKGLPYYLKSKLLKINSKDKKWHIMFHELWVGMNNEASCKLKLWGTLQRQLIKSLIVRLKPSVIHTQTALYACQLDKLGFKAQILPLFSNIKSKSINFNNEEQTIKSVNHTISFVIFGSVHAGGPIDEFSKEAAVLEAKKKAHISITFIGRGGVEQEHWANTFRKFGLKVEVLGEQNQEIISEVLYSASFGISTTPIALIEKSGAFSAMAVHRLPVLSLAKKWTLNEGINFECPQGVIEYSKGKLEEIIINTKTLPVTYTIAEVCTDFIQSIRLS